jgi:transcriptional repressor NrdR
MRCPYCQQSESSVLESRSGSDAESIRRRRECDRCGKRFTTYERVEGVDLQVVKKNGVIESFNREKLKKGIVKATWKRPISMSDIEDVMAEVERRLRLRSTTQIKSWEIGNLVMDHLRRLDPVAFILFASVYKDFQSLEDFQEEIQRLMCAIHHPEEKRKESISATLAGATGAAPDSEIKLSQCSEHDQKEFA